MWSNSRTCGTIFRNHNERKIYNIQTRTFFQTLRPVDASRTVNPSPAELSSSSGESSEGFYPPLSHIQAAPDPSAMSLSVTPAAVRGEQFSFYRNITGQSWWKSGLKAVWVHLKESRTSPLFLLPSPSSPFRSFLFNLLISAEGPRWNSRTEK